MTLLFRASLALVCCSCPLASAQVQPEPKANLFKGPSSRQISALAFAPDGKILAVGTKDGAIRLFDVPQATEQFALEQEIGAVGSLAFSKDGLQLAAGHATGEIAIWHVPQRRLLKSWKAHADGVGAVLWHPDGQRVITGGFDGVIRLWRDTKEEQAWKIPTGRVTCLAITADGKKLISGGIATAAHNFGNVTIRTTASDLVRSWDIASGKETATALRGMNVAITPNGSIIAAAGLVTVTQNKLGVSFDGRDRLYVLGAGKEKPLEHDGIGHLLTMSRDGKYLASGGQNFDAWFGGIIAYNGVEGRQRDNRLRLWDLSTGTEVLRLPQADARVIALGPDGKYLAAADEQHVVKIWDIEKEKRDPTPTPPDLALAPSRPGPGGRPKAPAAKAPPKQARPADPELEKLLAGLEQDYQELLKEDRRATFVREAAQDFLKNGPADYWTYRNALEKLRKNPAKAAVPLILKHLLDLPADNRPVWQADDYVNALVILTGEDLRRHFTRGSRSDALVTEWWASRKDKIILDPAKMSKEQNERRLTLLLGLAAKNDRGSTSSSAGLAYNCSARLRSILSPYASDRPTWFDNEIHTSMVPMVLERCGSDTEPSNGPDDRSINLQVVPMLAGLLKRGEAPELAKLGKDPNRPAAVRLSCLLAARVAGEDLPTGDIVEFYKGEKNLELRVLAVLALPATAKPSQAADELIAALDSNNANIRNAAIHALAKIQIPGAFTKLAALADQPSIQENWLTDRTLLDAIVQQGSPETKKFLAEQLELRLNKNDDKSISSVLRAFETATGQRWIEPGAHDNQYYRARAAKAVQWWKNQKAP